MRPSLLGTVVRVIALGIAGAASAIACGGVTAGPGGAGGSSGSSGSGTVSGNVGGTTFVVASEIAGLGTEGSSCTSSSGPDGGGGGETCTSTGQVVAILLTNRADVTCAAVQARATGQQNVQWASFASLELLVANASGTVAPGTYQVGPIAGATGTAAGASFGTTDATCGVQQQVKAQTGTITVTSLDATRVSGSYDVTFGTQGSFSGSFDVALCAPPDAGAGDGVDAGPPVCK